MEVRRIYSLATIVFVTGCTALGAVQMEKRFGQANPRERVVESLPADAIDYWDDVKPVVENRCVVCHGCYDAPCQLKMSSIEGIERGASEAKVYNSSRLKHAPLTRLYQDAQTPAQWRNKEFFPVLNEFDDTPEANREAGVMYRLLELKQDNPLPNVKQLPKSFDLSLDRKQYCAKPDTFDKYAQKHPLQGMPFALPAIPSAEQDVLMRWIEQGATYVARAPMDAIYQPFIDEWETFLNGDSLKAQLSSRYIFEHLVFAHLYFPEVDKSQFFQLVRSATPPGEPIKLIATRRPYNDPEVSRVYYRIQPHLGTLVAKTHMPYALDAKRMQRWQSLFIDEQYDVTELPSYEEKFASNPFLTFHELPVQSRYQFMLDEAQFTIMGFIKGPVCRGQVALNVINDHFWVFFLNPDNPATDEVDEFLSTQSTNMQLPAGKEDIYNPVGQWRKFADQQKTLLAEKDRFLTEHFSGENKLGLDLVWDGNGGNPNAALTVYRHFDSATVEQGLLGQPPKTAWLIGYTILERIHYLLVAGYDVYGNLGHQLVTRIYMDFLRMEGEANFLALVPESARIRERNFWYRGAEKSVVEYMTLPGFENQSTLAIDYKTDDEKLELYGMLEQRLEEALPTRHETSAITNARVRDELTRLTRLVGTPAVLMPETAFVRIETAAGDQYVTLVHNNAHLNITSIFGEKKERKPDEDTLDVIPGFIGTYPNVFMVVDESELTAFVDSISNLQTEEDYAALLDNYGIRRTNPEFWSNSDTFHAAYWWQYPLQSGMLDYSRLENR
jgi:hypothetical protein